MTPNLNCDAMSKAVINKTRNAWNRYFVTSGAIHNTYPSTALQLFRPVVAGCGIYLLCLIPPREEICKKFDDLSIQAGRLALRLPHTTPNSQVWSESGLMPLAAIMARERLRLLYKLSLSPYTGDLAVRILKPETPGTQSLGAGLGRLNATTYTG